MIDSNNIPPTDKKNTNTRKKNARGRPVGSTKNAKYLPQMKAMMLDLSKCGKSLTQIAVALSDEYRMPIIADTLISWEKTCGEAYTQHLKLCQTYAQAYHEDLLDKMIQGKVGNKEIAAQQWKLKTLFSDWGDRAQKIEVSQTASSSDTELTNKVIAMLKRTGNLPSTKPSLKVVNGTNEQQEEDNK